MRSSWPDLPSRVLQALESENQELLEQLRERQLGIESLEEELAQHVHQHGELRGSVSRPFEAILLGHSSHLESQWQGAEQRAMHHAARRLALRHRAFEMKVMDFSTLMAVSRP